MMRTRLLIPLFVPLLIFLSLCSASQREFQTATYDRGLAFYARILPHLGELVPSIVEQVKETVGEDVWSAEARETYAREVEALQGAGSGAEGAVERAELVECRQCVSLLAVALSLIRAGTDYDDVRDLSMTICHELVMREEPGMNEILLCELTLDSYAPHVVYILNATDKSARDICSLYGFCERDDLGIYDRIERGRVLSPPGGAAGERRGAADQGEAGGEKDAPTAAAGSLRPIKLLHITDMHADPKYAVGAPTDCDMPLCCRADSNGTGSSMYWGDYHCNIPQRTANRMLNYILNNYPPDLIAYTGDTFQHTIWDQTMEETIATDQWLTERLWYFFPGIPAYTTIGNHDMAPTNLYYIHREDIQAMNAAMFAHWTPLSKFGAAQRETFERGTYYTASPFPGLRILSYNSEYGASDNFYTVLTVDEPEYPEMLQWMEDTLSAARANNEKVILLGHHPTGGSGRVPGYNHFITDLQARYGDIVVLHLMGHNHDDNFSIVRLRETGEARGVQISSPSVTSYTDINPTLRILYLDPVTYIPLDMETFYIDLKADGDSGAPPIRRAYSMSEEYGMADLSAASYELLVDKFEADRDLLARYRYHMDTQTGREGNCDDRCAAHLFCRLRDADYTGRKACEQAIPLE